MSRDWNSESGSMGRFYYQLAVGPFGPKVSMGGRGVNREGTCYSEFIYFKTHTYKKQQTTFRV